MKKTSFAKLSPAQWRLFAGLGFCLVVGAIIYFLTLPTVRQRVETQEELTGRRKKNDEVSQALKTLPELQARIDALETTLAATTNRHVLRPVLGSYPVERTVRRLALPTGFKISAVRERNPKQTPRKESVPSGGGKRRGKRDAKEPAPPSDFLERFPVEIDGEGGFLDTLEFIRRVEKDNPYSGLLSLTIRANSQNPQRHRVTMQWEWPVGAHPK